MLALLKFAMIGWGIGALMTGKFWVGPGRTVVGPTARQAGLVVALEPLASIALGIVLSGMGVGITAGVVLVLELALIVTAIVIAYRVAGAEGRAAAAR